MRKIFTILLLLAFLGLSGFAQEKIFYVAKSVSNYYTIFSINTDGSDKIQIFNDSYHRTGVCVSSDDELYYLKRQNDFCNYGGSIVLCKSEINGQNETELWHFPDSATLDLRGSIELRLDKQKILYATYQCSNRDGDIFELDLTNLTSNNISNNNDYPPQGSAKYSPDLTKILYIELATTWYAYPWNMYLINSNVTNKVQITPGGNASFYCPSFSHDGSKIVYCSYTGLTSPLNLFIANSNGTNGQQIIPSSGASTGILHPVYSPDDTKLVFYRSPNLVITDTAGTVITEFPIETIEDQSNITWANLNICYQTVYDTIVTTVYDTTYVTVTDTNYVTINDTVHISVTDTLIINAVLTGINPPQNINTIKVFPNPAKTHIYINTGNYTTMNGYTIKIDNSLGQTVFTTPVSQQQYYIDLSSWTGNGIYFVYIIDNLSNTIDVRKIILQ